MMMTMTVITEKVLAGSLSVGDEILYKGLIIKVKLHYGDGVHIYFEKGSDIVAIPSYVEVNKVVGKEPDPKVISAKMAYKKSFAAILSVDDVLFKINRLIHQECDKAKCVVVINYDHNSELIPSVKYHYKEIREILLNAGYEVVDNQIGMTIWWNDAE